MAICYDNRRVRRQGDQLNIASTRTAPSSSSTAKRADLTVVGGCGHVGIPLVLAFAEAGLTVNVHDIKETALATLRSGKLPFIEHGAAPLLANQFYMIAKSAGADYQAIMRAMKQNYPRARSFPGPGFSAGPCLFKDTMQLVAYARNQFGMGHAAMQVNEGFVLQLVDDLRRSYRILEMTVGLLGMAFKAEIDDIRASLSYKLKRNLQLYARKVLTTDPFVTSDLHILPLEQVVEGSDILILCTPHSVYAEADLKGKPVVDVWGFLKNANIVY